MTYSSLCTKAKPGHSHGAEKVFPLSQNILQFAVPSLFPMDHLCAMAYSTAAVGLDLHHLLFVGEIHLWKCWLLDAIRGILPTMACSVVPPNLWFSGQE